jgi:hypothetical protein
MTVEALFRIPDADLALPILVFEIASCLDRGFPLVRKDRVSPYLNVSNVPPSSFHAKCQLPMPRKSTFYPP